MEVRSCVPLTQRKQNYDRATFALDSCGFDWPKDFGRSPSF